MIRWIVAFIIFAQAPVKQKSHISNDIKDWCVLCQSQEWRPFPSNLNKPLVRFKI
ncbi:MAG: hypothetical protein HW387_644 [Parachlamydiales bacterium]|nr:hypothetical protein [Parachlamydiales bacterium]